MSSLMDEAMTKVSQSGSDNIGPSKALRPFHPIVGEVDNKIHDLLQEVSMLSYNLRQAKKRIKDLRKVSTLAKRALSE
jgi:hypothetical protein